MIWIQMPFFFQLCSVATWGRYGSLCRRQRTGHCAMYQNLSKPNLVCLPQIIPDVQRCPTSEKSWHSIHQQHTMTEKPNLPVFVIKRPRNLDNVSKQCLQGKSFMFCQINLTAHRSPCHPSPLALHVKGAATVNENSLFSYQPRLNPIGSTIGS